MRYLFIITEHEFINIKFKEGELEHGQRYIVCIHAEYTEIQHEKWTQILPEINTCSDGIVVDLTPPTAGKVWIGTQSQRYQVMKFLFFFFVINHFYTYFVDFF